MPTKSDNEINNRMKELEVYLGCVKGSDPRYNDMARNYAITRKRLAKQYELPPSQVQLPDVKEDDVLKEIEPVEIRIEQNNEVPLSASFDSSPFLKMVGYHLPRALTTPRIEISFRGQEVFAKTVAVSTDEDLKNNTAAMNMKLVRVPGNNLLYKIMVYIERPVQRDPGAFGRYGELSLDFDSGTNFGFFHFESGLESDEQKRGQQFFIRNAAGNNVDKINFDQPYTIFNARYNQWIGFDGEQLILTPNPPQAIFFKFTRTKVEAARFADADWIERTRRKQVQVVLAGGSFEDLMRTSLVAFATEFGAWAIPAIGNLILNLLKFLLDLVVSVIEAVVGLPIWALVIGGLVGLKVFNRLMH